MTSATHRRPAAADRVPNEPDLLEALEPKAQAEAEPLAANEADSTVPAVEVDEATYDEARKAPKKIAGSGQLRQAIKTRRRPS